MIYRITFTRRDDDGEHCGYEYASSREEACEVVRSADEEGLDAVIDDKAPVPKNAQQVVDLLERWGSHPNNG